MCVLLITRLLRGVGRWARKPVNHTSWVAVVTPTDRPKSVRNCCLIELFCGVVCVVTLSLWHFCWYRGFCHRTGSDLLLFVSIALLLLFVNCQQMLLPSISWQVSEVINRVNAVSLGRSIIVASESLRQQKKNATHNSYSPSGTSPYIPEGADGSSEYSTNPFSKPETEIEWHTVCIVAVR